MQMLCSGRGCCRIGVLNGRTMRARMSGTTVQREVAVALIQGRRAECGRWRDEMYFAAVVVVVVVVAADANG